jgi:hypothetical protein
MLAPRTSPALALAVALAATAGAPSAAAAENGRLDLVSFANVDLTEWERIHRRSESPPIKLAEVHEMQAAGIGDKAILEMIRTRRVVDRVAPKDLIRLKKGGASDDLIAAVSAFALKENRSIDLLLTLDVDTVHSVALAPFLYVELFHTGLKKREHLLFADMRSLLSRRGGAQVLTDRSDPLIPGRLRRVRVRGSVPVLHPGPVEVRILLSKKPDILSLGELDEAQAKRVKRYAFTLPPVSLYHHCELELRLARDELLKDLFTVSRSRFECTFE